MVMVGAVGGVGVVLEEMRSGRVSEDWDFGQEVLIQKAAQALAELQHTVLQLKASGITDLELKLKESGLDGLELTEWQPKVYRRLRGRPPLSPPPPLPIILTPSQSPKNSSSRRSNSDYSALSSPDPRAAHSTQDSLGGGGGAPFCNFCFNNARCMAERNGRAPPDKGQVSAEWRSHRCKDSQGHVLCPVLSKLKCKECGATGDDAHTLRYCPRHKGRLLQRRLAHRTPKVPQFYNNNNNNNNNHQHHLHHNIMANSRHNQLRIGAF